MAKKKNNLEWAIMTVLDSIYDDGVGGSDADTVDNADTGSGYIDIQGLVVARDSVTDAPTILFTAKQWVYYMGMYECIAEAQSITNQWPGDDDHEDVMIASVANELVNGLNKSNQERIKRLQIANEEMLAKFGPDSHK